MSLAGPIPPDMSMRNVTFKLTRATGILARLRRDHRGNTLAMTAAAMVPLAGMVGGGLDLSRLYLTKTRLQHACDAGALAGRKSMGAGTWGQNSSQPRTTANLFFDGNFEDGSYGSKNMSRTFTENAGKVSGRAQADVPMTLMKIFSMPTQTMVVTCDAEMRLPNTDVMFVLDTTGSMADPQPGDTVSKMSALKTAVKCFYEIVARLDTNATCTTGTPSGGTGTQVQIRFGFVPYNSEVNVGKLLPTSWFADSWNYQTRKPVMRTETVTVDGPWSNGQPQLVSETTELTSNTDWQTYATANPNRSGNCTADDDDPTTYTGPEGAPYNQNESVSGNTRTTTWTTRTDAKRQYKYQVVKYNGLCYLQRRINYGLSYRNYRRVDTKTQTTQTNVVFDKWEYNKLSVDVSSLKNGTSWNSSVNMPIGSSGATIPVPWDGCIEERPTVRTTNYNPIPDGSGSSKAWDLDIDRMPDADANTLWGPALYGAIFTRRGTFANWNRDMIQTTAEYGNSAIYNCPTEAKLLQKWPDASVVNQPSFDTYVDSLQASGGTYHDIGLLWGARLLSGTGPFRNPVMLPSGQMSGQNATTSQGGEIERHLIFMTDGDACTYDNMYAAYGLSWFDRRQTPDNTVPTTGCTDTGTLTEQVNLRTAAICTAVKNKNITLWVVAFGTLANSTVTRLTACASPGRYFTATNSAQLQATFKSIADQISQLRLTS